MGFLKRLLGGEKSGQSGDYVDEHGIYMYAQCDNCQQPVRVRIDKQHDLISEGGDYVWHKTIVDSRCFRPMPTVVRFDSGYQVKEHEISGGHYISHETYQSLLAAAAAARKEEAATSDEETE